MNDPSQVSVRGPLGPFAAGFLYSLAKLGYTPNSASSQLHLMAHLSRWLAAQRIDVRMLRDKDMERFLRARRRAGYASWLSVKAMRPMLAYLKDEGVSLHSSAEITDRPVDVAVECYRQYLLRERGLGQRTARLYGNAVRLFVQSHLSGNSINWKSLDAAKVTAFVVAHTPNQSRSLARITVTALRSFVGFLYVTGRIAQPLTSAVPSVAGWRLSSLPKALQPGEAKALLASCDRRTKKGRRDFAILTMLVRLGLRAGEIAALRFDDINWRAGTILIRAKGNQIEPLPCPVDVGEAVVAYLRRGRPATAVDHVVFVRVRAPHRALSGTGVSEIVVAAARRAELGNIRAHRLRHTVATELLRSGSPLPEIGQLLRHRHVSTTAIYAKVDRTALRSVARPWLGGVA
jgi:site-specific recombinase XerD